MKRSGSKPATAEPSMTRQLWLMPGTNPAPAPVTHTTNWPVAGAVTVPLAASRSQPVPAAPAASGMSIFKVPAPLSATAPATFRVPTVAASLAGSTRPEMDSAPTVPAPRSVPPTFTACAEPAEVPLATSTPASTVVVPR